MNPENSRVSELEAQARTLGQQGRQDAALRCWHQLLEIQPGHAMAASQVGAGALARGDLAGAKSLLEQAVQNDPKLALAHANLSRVHSAQGEPKKALAAIDQAVAADPEAWGPHLERAKLLEAAGRTHEAAMSWGNLLTFLPPQLADAPQLQEMLKHARRAVKQTHDALHTALVERMHDLMGGAERRELRRFEHCLDILTGRRPFVTARPLVLPFPELPAIPYFNREDYPWVAEVEAAFPDMLEELNAVLELGEGFVPYVRTRPGERAAQFADLDHNMDWGSYFMWNNGERVDANADRCPRTEAAIQRAPQCLLPQRGPVIMYSALKPRTHIPPHNGATNIRLTTHMPLIIPPDCALRVGDKEHVWEPGKLVLFDDTIQHEAWNRSDRLRVIIIFDTWNPLLTELERELVSQAVQGMVSFYGTNADLGEL